MKLLSSIKQLLTNSKRQTTSTLQEDDTTNVLRQMQAICNALPDGEMLVDRNGNALTITLRWNATSSPKKEKTGNGDAPVAEQRISSDKKKKDRSGDAIVAEQRISSEKSKSKETIIQKLTRFLRTNYAFRYNLLTDQTECAKKQKDSDHLIYMPADQRTFNGICLDAINEGVKCWDRDVKRYIESDKIETYHPFRLYFDTLPKWDGKDRLTELAQRVDDSQLWTNAFHRWMLATVAQWTGMNDGQRANSVAPLLISTTQGMGKSTFCRMLMPTELRRYFTESYDLTAQSSAEQKLAAFGLINIDEFDKLSAKKMPLLKDLMQMQSLNLRRAYKRSTEPLQRIASFIATSNSRDLLTDLSGSRRFVCIELKKQIDCSPIDHAQIYAQLKTELQNGERYWFTKQEEAEIQEHNKPYYRTTPAEEVFTSTFTPAEPNAEGARLMTAAEIYAELRRHNAAAMRDVSPTTFARLLPMLAQRVHTKFCNGYWLK